MTLESLYRKLDRLNFMKEKLGHDYDSSMISYDYFNRWLEKLSNIQKKLLLDWAQEVSVNFVNWLCRYQYALENPFFYLYNDFVEEMHIKE